MNMGCIRKVFRNIVTFFLTIFFNLLYTKFAFTYDWVAFIVSAGHWKTWVASIIPLLSSENLPLLELGFGTGHLQGALLTNWDKIYGLDASKQMLKIAFQNIYKLSENPNHPFSIKIIQAKTNHIPFPDQSFLSIISTFPAPYIFEKNTLLEIYRLLKPKGKLIILLSARITGQGWGNTLSKLIYKLAGQSHPSDCNMILTLDRIRACGFSVSYLLKNIPDSELLFVVAQKT